MEEPSPVCYIHRHVEQGVFVALIRQCLATADCDAELVLCRHWKINSQGFILIQTLAYCIDPSYYIIMLITGMKFLFDVGYAESASSKGHVRTDQSKQSS